MVFDTVGSRGTLFLVVPPRNPPRCGTVDASFHGQPPCHEDRDQRGQHEDPHAKQLTFAALVVVVEIDQRLDDPG
jgi:hypothetical protein